MKPPMKSFACGSERTPARMPLPVYLLLAAVLVAVTVHGVILAQPRRCAVWQSLVSSEAGR